MAIELYHEESGTRLSVLENGESTIGREGDVKIPKGMEFYEQVSRIHCYVARIGGNYFVRVIVEIILF